MNTITLRCVPEDIHLLLQTQAKHKSMTQNEYILQILSQAAIVGMPDLARQLPDVIQYLVRTIILSDQERTRAYTEAQMSLLRDCMETLKETREFLKGKSP
jgi:superfamily I DNA/RNA helicase